MESEQELNITLRLELGQLISNGIWVLSLLKAKKSLSIYFLLVLDMSDSKRSRYRIVDEFDYVQQTRNIYDIRYSAAHYNRIEITGDFDEHALDSIVIPQIELEVQSLEYQMVVVTVDQDPLLNLHFLELCDQLPTNEAADACNQYIEKLGYARIDEFRLLRSFIKYRVMNIFPV